MVVSELRGEKIDIIPWNPEPARFVAKALSPARVREVLVDDESSEATVVVPDDQLSLAIGKEGLNARLAARLTGWKIDIQSETEFARSRGRRGLRRRRTRSSPAAASRCSRPASAARTRRFPARTTAASPPTARSRSARPPARTSPPRSSSPPRPSPKSRRASRRGEAVRGAEAEATPSSRPTSRGRRRGRAARWRPGPPPQTEERESRRRRPLPNERAREDVRRLRAESAAARVGALRRTGRGASGWTGRGARRAVGRTLHARLSCFERAADRRAFSRTLRRTVRIPGKSRLRDWKRAEQWLIDRDH